MRYEIREFKSRRQVSVAEHESVAFELCISYYLQSGKTKSYYYIEMIR